MDTWKAITCETSGSITGQPHPRLFVWENTALRITDIGRRWQEADGYHLLARVVDGRVFELRYQLARQAWTARLRAVPPGVV